MGVRISALAMPASCDMIDWCTARNPPTFAAGPFLAVSVQVTPNRAAWLSNVQSLSRSIAACWRRASLQRCFHGPRSCGHLLSTVPNLNGGDVSRWSTRPVHHERQAVGSWREVIGYDDAHRVIKAHAQFQVDHPLRQRAQVSQRSTSRRATRPGDRACGRSWLPAARIARTTSRRSRLPTG